MQVNYLFLNQTEYANLNVYKLLVNTRPNSSQKQTKEHKQCFSKHAKNRFTQFFSINYRSLTVRES
jgi:hypothetical protein